MHMSQVKFSFEDLEVWQKNKFYYFARGSVVYTESHLEYDMRVGYLDNFFVI